MARLKLTLSSLCLGSKGGRVSKSGEVSKSFFFPVIMYVENPNVYCNRAEQVVVLLLEVKSLIPGTVLYLNTSKALFSLICFFSYLSLSFLT